MLALAPLKARVGRSLWAAATHMAEQHEEPLGLLPQALARLSPDQPAGPRSRLSTPLRA